MSVQIILFEFLFNFQVDDQGNLLYDPIIKVLPNSLFESANILFSYCVPRAGMMTLVIQQPYIIVF